MADERVVAVAPDAAGDAEAQPPVYAGWVTSGAWARLTAGPAKVYLVLLNHSGQKRVCWPSVKRLEEQAGLTRRGVFVALRALESLGMVTRDSGGGMHSATTRYRLMECPTSQVNHGSPVNRGASLRCTTVRSTGEPGCTLNSSIELSQGNAFDDRERIAVLDRLFGAGRWNGLQIERLSAMVAELGPHHVRAAVAELPSGQRKPLRDPIQYVWKIAENRSRGVQPPPNTAAGTATRSIRQIREEAARLSATKGGPP
ncbi:MAG: hypothetical protein AMXMBFR13_47480 [Phycisphaerae bacterium]